MKQLNFLNQFSRMKEETLANPQQNSIISNGEGKSINFSASPNSSIPKPRFKHQSFIYKNKIYVYGGTTVPSSEFTDDAHDLYAYDLQIQPNQKWQKLKTKCGPNTRQIQSISAFASVLSGSKWFIFGGSNGEFKQNNQLLRLNLETLEWTKLDQKGDVPTPRQSAFLTFYQKNWLLLYGGVSTSEVQIYNTFHFYNVDTKNWSKCEGSYAYQVYARLDPALLLFNDHLYMFGGTYRNMNNQQKYLDDFYEIRVNTPGRNMPGKIAMKRLISPLTPQKRSGHSLIGLADRYILLIGGQNTKTQIKEGLRSDDIKLVEDIWIYDTRYLSWNRLQLQNQHFKFRSMASCVNFNEKIYLFGGIYNYNNILGDLVEIALDVADLGVVKRRNSPCIKCHQKQLYPLQSKSFSTHIIEDIAQNITFPFAAIGLLIDNSMNNGASLLRIAYNQISGSLRLKVLKFEDDARLMWTQQEIINSISNFNTGQMYIPSGIDKKIKTTILKDNARRQYGYNLKIASLRLGQFFIFVSFIEDTMNCRIFMFRKETVSSNQKYILYHYTYNVGERRTLTPEMQQIRSKVFGQYADYIDNIISHKKSRNTLLIFNPYIQDGKDVPKQEELELKADFQSNNIFYGSVDKIRCLQQAGFSITECVDVSLRAYITCLYIKNQSMKITLSVKQTQNNPIEIQTQSFLDKVDRLCKQKHVLQINSAFEFDLKISELYLLYDIKKKLYFFNNGLLIYHKNRLITRYKYPLGQLISRKYYKYDGNHNFIRLFGSIQLPDHIPINIFKTNYLHHIMMEKLFSRLKLINKMFKKQLLKITKDPEYKRAAPLKLTQEEQLKERIELSEQKPPSSREKPKKEHQQQRQIGLRKRKNKQDKIFQQKFNNLMRQPTTENLQQFLKYFEMNKKQKQSNSKRDIQSISPAKLTSDQTWRQLKQQTFNLKQRFQSIEERYRESFSRAGLRPLSSKSASYFEKKQNEQQQNQQKNEKEDEGLMQIENEGENKNQSQFIESVRLSQKNLMNGQGDGEISHQKLDNSDKMVHMEQGKEEEAEHQAGQALRQEEQAQEQQQQQQQQQQEKQKNQEEQEQGQVQEEQEQQRMQIEGESQQSNEEQQDNMASAKESNQIQEQY